MLRMKLAHIKYRKQKEKAKRSLYELSKLHGIYGHEINLPSSEHVCVRVSWTEEASIPCTACKQRKVADMVASRTLESPKRLPSRNGRRFDSFGNHNCNFHILALCYVAHGAHPGVDPMALLNCDALIYFMSPWCVLQVSASVSS